MFRVSRYETGQARCHRSRKPLMSKLSQQRPRREAMPQRKCDVNNCEQRHHPLLHNAPRIYDTSKAKQEISDSDSEISKSVKHVGASLTDNSECDVAISVVPITVHNAGIKIETFAILDNGAEVSLIDQSVADKLKLTGRKLPLTISTLNGNGKTIFSTLTSLVVSSRDGSFVISVPQVRVIPQLDLQRRQFDWPKLKRRLLTGHRPPRKRCSSPFSVRRDSRAPWQRWTRRYSYTIRLVCRGTRSIASRSHTFAHGELNCLAHDSRHRRDSR